MDQVDEKVLAVLRSMSGVIRSDAVAPSLREKLLEEEKRYASLGPIAIDNVGVKEAVSRERLYVIIKDRNFRPPPAPTVILTNAEGEILGEELIPGHGNGRRPEERTISLGKDFVIYSERAKGRGKDSKFVLPVVPFPEIEKLEFTRNVISASPSTMGDVELKNSLGIGDDPRFASILVAFDLAKQIL